MCLVALHGPTRGRLRRGWPKKPAKYGWQWKKQTRYAHGTQTPIRASLGRCRNSPSGEKLKGRYQPLPGFAAAAEAVRAAWGKFDEDIILLPLIPDGTETWAGTLIGTINELALHYSTNQGFQFD